MSRQYVDLALYDQALAVLELAPSLHPLSYDACWQIVEAYKLGLAGGGVEDRHAALVRQEFEQRCAGES